MPTKPKRSAKLTRRQKDIIIAVVMHKMMVKLESLWREQYFHRLTAEKDKRDYEEITKYRG